MKRLLVALVASFAAGIYAFRLLGTEDFLLVMLAVVLALSLKTLLFRMQRKSLWAMALCFLLGASYISIVDAMQIRKVEPYAGEPVTIYCKLVDLPEVSDQRTALTAQVFGVTPAGGTAPEEADFRIFLTVYDTETNFHYGDYLRAEVTPQWFETEQNEGGFDSASYYKTKRIWVRSGLSLKDVEQLDRSQFLASRGLAERVADFSAGFREKVLMQADRFYAGDAAAISKAILIGYKADMSEDLKSAFAACGISHLIAVSGMHVGVVFLLACILLRIFTKSKRTISAAGICLILLFTLVAGCTPSVVRAAVMYVLYLAASLLRREKDSLTLLSFAALLILIVNPFSAFDVGFILTFSATIGILLLSPIFARLLRFLPHVLCNLIALTLSAGVTTFPFLAYYFNEISVVSIVPNVIFVPLLPVVMSLSALTLVLGSIFAPLGLAAAWATNLVFTPMLQLIYRIAELSRATAVVARPDALFILLYFAVILAAYLLWRRERRKVISTALVCAMLVCCMIFSHAGTNGDLRVRFINVGQGDSALIQFPDGRSMLIDGGGTPGTNDYVGENILIPFLRSCGVTHLDYAVISHFHEDHAEGVMTLLEKGYIGTLYTPPSDEESAISREVDALIRENGVERVELSEGMAITGAGLRFDILSPEKNDYISNENNRSLVMMLRYGDVSFLFTGDCETNEAERIDEAYRVKCSVLKVPHHGAENAFHPDFALEALPEYAVISVGRNNTYGHPSAEVVSAYLDMGTRVYRTDENGNIEFTTDGTRIKNVRMLTSRYGY